MKRPTKGRSSLAKTVTAQVRCSRLRVQLKRNFTWTAGELLRLGAAVRSERLHGHDSTAFAGPTQFSSDCSIRDSIRTDHPGSVFPEVTHMVCCGSCGKAVPLPSAHFTQDLDANTVGLCSPTCRDAWYKTMFPPNTPCPTPTTARSAGSPARHFRPDRMDAGQADTF
jgi:hypothetical protein